MASLSVLAMLFAAAVAYWQWRRASRATSALNAALDNLPQTVADAIRVITQCNPPGTKVDPALNAGWTGAVEYLDINSDGRKELLVQYPVGAHGSELKILSWRGGKFEEVARLGVGTPVGFEFGDFDRDGRIEIKTQDTDWEANLPYAVAPRLLLLFRLEGTNFKEVSRNKLTEATAP